MAKALSGQRPMPGSIRFAPMQRGSSLFPLGKEDMMEKSHRTRHTLVRNSLSGLKCLGRGQSHRQTRLNIAGAVGR